MGDVSRDGECADGYGLNSVQDGEFSTGDEREFFRRNYRLLYTSARAMLRMLCPWGTSDESMLCPRGDFFRRADVNYRYLDPVGLNQGPLFSVL